MKALTIMSLMCLTFTRNLLCKCVRVGHVVQLIDG